MKGKSLDAELDNLEDVNEEDAAEIKRKSDELRKILSKVAKKRAVAQKEQKKDRVKENQ